MFLFFSVLCLSIKVLLANNACVIFDTKNELCFCCGFDYYNKEYWEEKNYPFPPNNCFEKTGIYSNMQIFVSTETACSAEKLCDGSFGNPFDSLENALDYANEISHKSKAISMEIVLFCEKKLIFLWPRQGKIYFRRTDLNLTIRPGYCKEFSGMIGCLDDNADLKIKLKTAEIRIFVSSSSYIKLQNLIIDAGDLLLSPEDDCILAKTNETCCSEEEINREFNKTNVCGIKERKYEGAAESGQRGLFNVERNHDASEKKVPLIFLKNIKFVNFHPFGAAGLFYDSLISLVENLEGKLSFEGVKLINCSFAVGVLSYASKLFFGKYSFAVAPAVTTEPLDLGVSIDQLTIENYNPQYMIMPVKAPLFDFKSYKGFILIKNCNANHIYLSQSSLFSVGNPGSSLSLYFQNFTLRYCAIFQFLYSDRSDTEFKVIFKQANFFENSIYAFMWMSKTPFLVLDTVIFLGELPEFSFVVIERTSVLVLNSIFTSMYNRYKKQAILFTSLSEYIMSLNVQFYDASITRTFVAQDSFVFVNTNITDSNSTFSLLTCTHSLLEVKFFEVNFLNLSLKSMVKEFVSAPVEKNFTVFSCRFKYLELDNSLILLYPCIRVYFDDVVFFSIRNNDNHLIYFHTTTVLSKIYHVYGFNNTLFENIEITFDTPEIEKKPRYFIFVRYGTMGNGGTIFITNTNFKNISFQKDFGDNKLVYIACVYCILSRIIIEKATNTTIIHHRATAEYATFDVSDIVMSAGLLEPIRMFFNTEKEYILEAKIRNCTVIASKMTGSNLIVLNNIKTLRITMNYFKGAATAGALLNVGVESLSKILINENIFEGIPERNISTVGIIYGSNSISGQLGSGLYGIINCTFKNLLGSAIVVSEKSELTLSSNSFVNISAESGPLLTMKASSLVSLSKFYALNLKAIFDGGVINLLASVLLVSSGNISSCSSGGLGGVIFSMESVIVLTNLSFFSSFGKSGGLIFGDASNISLMNAIIMDSSAAGYGGCLFTEFGELKMMNILIKNAKANVRGGSIYAEGSLLTLKNVTFEKSVVYESGTVILFGNSAEQFSVFEEVRFFKNVAKSVPTFLIYDTVLYAFDLSIEENESGSSGTIIEAYFFYLECALILERVHLRGNVASGEDSKLILLFHSKISIKTGKIDNNEAVKHIYSEGVESDIEIVNSAFISSNTATYPLGLSYLFVSCKQARKLLIQKSSFSGGNIIQMLSCSLCSDIQIEDSKFQEFQSGRESNFVIKNSKMSVKNSDFQTNTGKTFGVFYFEDSETIILESSRFLNNRCLEKDCTAVINVKNAKALRLSKLSLLSITILGIENVAVAITNIQIVLINCLFTGNASARSKALLAINPFGVSLSKCNFSDFSLLGAISIQSNNRIQSETLDLINYFEISLQNINFNNCSSEHSGGGLSVTGPFTLHINNSEFINCFSGEDGGGIFYNCPYRYCKLTIVGRCNFMQCSAGKQGGAIQTFSIDLNISSQSSFSQNNASVGKDLASIPYNLYVQSFANESVFQETRQNAPDTSSYFELGPLKSMILPIGHQLKLGVFLLDTLNNLLTIVSDVFVRANITRIEDAKTGKILNISETGLILKNALGKLEGGTFYFSQIAIQSDIADVTVDLKIQTEVSGYYLESSINVTLVKCPRGNVFFINRCIPCELNYFSLEEDSFSTKRGECDLCPPNADCQGGDEIIPAPGYWRMSRDTAVIQKCVTEEACPLTIGNFYSSVCGVGYTGNLCFLCQEGFGKSSNKCVECFKNSTFWLVFIFGNFIFFGFTLFTKKTILHKTSDEDFEEKESQLLLKIFVNHFSYLTIISLFGFDWKEHITEAFNFMNSYITTSPQSMFALVQDCFFQAEPNEKHKKMFVFLCFSPITFTLMSYLISFCYESAVILGSHSINYLRGKNSKPKSLKLKENFQLYFGNKQSILTELEGCLLIVCLNIYPTVIMKLIDVFRCQNLTEKTRFLLNNPNIECWSNDHSPYIALSVTFLLLWGAGVPIYFYFRSKVGRRELKKHGIKINSQKITMQLSFSVPASSLPKSKVKDNIRELPIVTRADKAAQNINLFLVSGYKKQFSYWESIMFVKKALAIFASLFMSYLDKRSITALIVFIFLSFFFINEKWNI